MIMKQECISSLFKKKSIMNEYVPVWEISYPVGWV